MGFQKKVRYASGPEPFSSCGDHGVSKKLMIRSEARRESSETPATRGMWSDVYELQYCRESSLTEAQKSADAALRGPDASAAGSGEAGLSDRTLALALTNDIGLKERSLDSIRDLLVMLRLSSWLMTPSRRRQLGLHRAQRRVERVALGAEAGPADEERLARPHQAAHNGVVARQPLGRAVCICLGGGVE